MAALSVAHSVGVKGQCVVSVNTKESHSFGSACVAC